MARGYPALVLLLTSRCAHHGNESPQGREGPWECGGGQGGALGDASTIGFFQGQKVVVCLELGHICNVKEHIWTNPGYTTKSFDEATHDWEFFIRDVHKGDMKQYTDKIIVNLHETFKNPRRGRNDGFVD